MTFSNVLRVEPSIDRLKHDHLCHHFQNNTFPYLYYCLACCETALLGPVCLPWCLYVCFPLRICMFSFSTSRPARCPWCRRRHRRVEELMVWLDLTFIPFMTCCKAFVCVHKWLHVHSFADPMVFICCCKQVNLNGLKTTDRIQSLYFSADTVCARTRQHVYLNLVLDSCGTFTTFNVSCGSKSPWSQGSLV